MKISILTLGCRTNQAESLYLQRILCQKGHHIVNLSENPDFCIVNTCSVTAEAERQSRQLINKTLKKGSKVLVTGCYSELYFDRLAKKYDNLIFIKNEQKSNIINMFNHNTSEITKRINFYLERHRPIIKIQEGCNYSCSYCTIPLTRGKQKSIDAGKIIDEIKYFEENGFKEIVLTGTHLGTYGNDLIPKSKLSMLLKEILNKTNISRIRLSSLDINEIDEELLEIISHDRVCRHLHIPLQSGDDHILKLMNRRYTFSVFKTGIDRIIKKLPDISIGTDIIVGFPQETVQHFENTKKVIELMPFSYIHVFPFSKRPNTEASSFNGQIPDDIKRYRVSEIRNLGNEKKLKYINRFIGKTLDVLVEESREGYFLGTAGNYIKVLIDERYDIPIGEIVNVRVVSIKNLFAIGNPE